MTVFSVYIHNVYTGVDPVVFENMQLSKYATNNILFTERINNWIRAQ